MPDAPCAFPTQKPSRAAAALESRPSSAACPPELQLRPAVPICMTLQMKPLPDPGSQARLCTGLWSLPAALEVPGHRLRRSLPPPRKSSLTVPGHNNHSHWGTCRHRLGMAHLPVPCFLGSHLWFTVIPYVSPTPTPWRHSSTKDLLGKVNEVSFQRPPQVTREG